MSNEKNAFLIYNDQVNLATVTSTDTYDPSLQNVRDRRLQKIARCSDTATSIIISFASPVYIGGIGVLNSNANDALANIWTLCSDASGLVPISTGSFIAGLSVSNRPRNIYAITSDGSNTLCQSIEIQLANEDGDNLFIGRIFAGRCWYSAEGAKFGSLSLGRTDPSTVVRALDGTPYVTERVKYRNIQLEWPALDDEELYLLDGTNATNRECLDDIQSTVGSSQEVILLPSYLTGTGSALIMSSQTVYGLAEWGDVTQYEKSGGEWVYSQTVKVTESV